MRSHRLPSSDFGLRDYGTGTWEGGDEGCEHERGRLNSGHASDVGQRNAEGNAFRNSGRYVGQGDATPHVCGKCGARRIDDQIGLESSPQEWCDRLVDVFREVRRVLRRDGTLWVECGDSYGSGGHNGKDYVDGGKTQMALAGQTYSRSPFKPKDQLLAPHLLAAALRDDGWYLRSTIIWAKPNPMPESVTDRPTSAHSYVFLLAKSSRYFWDSEAIREPHTGPLPEHYGKIAATDDRSLSDGVRPWDFAAGRKRVYNPAGRNSRTIWTIPTEPNGLAVCANPDCQGYWQRKAPRQHCGLPVVQHYAAFPRELVRRCILAGTSARGCCPECGAPWKREVEAQLAAVTRKSYKGAGHVGNHRGTAERPGGYEGASSKTLGWRPTCECGDLTDGHHMNWAVPCTVLDPFAGSGTTLVVARQHGRHAIGIDLNEAYARMTRHRLSQQSLFARAEGAA